MKIHIFFYVIVFCLGLIFGWYGLPGHYHAKITREIRQGQLRYTNPLLECDEAQESISSPLGVSKFKLQEYIDSQTSYGKVQLVSLYFRDLNNGPWIGINEREEFIGASLVKVPLLMAYLKEAETDPGILNLKIKYENQIAKNSQYFDPTKEIELGKEYTVSQLLESMVKYSDNNAAALLGDHINPQAIINTFDALGLGLPDFNKTYPVSVRTYSGFFRVLFNASYLNINMSENALTLLSLAEFNSGLEAGLPQGISIAHKFGIRESGETDKQLHDCGIVYYPGHPYTLCIMTKGDNFDNQAKVIADPSRMVYEEVEKGNK